MSKKISPSTSSSAATSPASSGPSTASAPTLIHITGPSELGLLGLWFAHRRGIPLAASWHTNVHQYAARRLNWLSHHFPNPSAVEDLAESTTLWATSLLYRYARVLFAPNPDLCDLLERITTHPCHLMQRGVDTDLFNPAHRTRSATDNKLILGYVGRLSIEKNIALLPIIEQQLAALGIHNVEFLIIGHGAEEASLRAALPAAKANFAGVLRGPALATAYANMDLLVFPSHTDTFGNVVLEALASGVPAIVTPDGGPQYIVEHGATGFIAPDAHFAAAIALLAADPCLLNRMRQNARTHALTRTWDAVFHRVYSAYNTVLNPPPQYTPAYCNTRDLTVHNLPVRSKPLTLEKEKSKLMTFEREKMNCHPERRVGYLPFPASPIAYPCRGHGRNLHYSCF